MWPLTNASWALSSPVATATAVSHDCSMRTCSGSAAPGAEAGLAVADLEVVGDVALRAVGDDLGDADLVRRRRARAARSSAATTRDSSSIHSRLR